MSAISIPIPQETQYRNILGIRFFTGSASEAVELGAQGRLVVAPAAPALCELGRDTAYRHALQQADLVLTDSGLLVLLWNTLNRDSITRVSGLKYLRTLLLRQELKERSSSFWVMPSIDAMKRNLAWLRDQGCCIEPDDCYVAPHYGRKAIADDTLVKQIDQRRSRHIVICLGGGTQEKLGLYLKQRCAFQPAIHCIGAAIGFLSGDQVHIPDWADKMMLGWLFRCISQPRRFVPRYLRAVQLPLVLLRYRSRSPEPV
jgi:N-acetylglucosaminyldiphosphoundecaprenol N-acetyl-beta-D-mannosaminyltransferase